MCVCLVCIASNADRCVYALAHTIVRSMLCFMLCRLMCAVLCPVRVALAEACGKVLAEDIVCVEPVPSCRTSVMVSYVLRWLAAHECLSLTAHARATYSTHPIVKAWHTNKKKHTMHPKQMKNRITLSIFCFLHNK